jgi:multiple sugar transport system permease protein
LGAVAVGMAVTIPGAYAFTRLRFPLKKPLFYYVILSLFFPWIVLIIPLYNIYTKLGMMNTFAGVIIAYTVVISPLCLWLLRGFFSTALDKDIEGAAMIDGCTLMGAFFRVILPLSMPAVVATATFTFLVAWNEFIWVFLLTSGEAKRTAVVGIHYLMGSDVARDYNALLAAVLMTSLPPVLFYSFLQGFLTKAFATAGGTKY